MMARTPGRHRRSPRALVGTAAALVLAMLLVPPWAAAQEASVEGALALLLTQRSISTGDAVADTAATQATARAMAGSLRAASTSLPAAASAGGFAFHLEAGLGGAAVRSSVVFGALFTERALTSGRGAGSFDVRVRHASFGAYDGRQLRDGTLVATANRSTGESAAFDAESVAIRLDASTVTLAGMYGLSDQVDVTGIVPLVRLTLRGERTNTYRGRTAPLASADATVAGIGDVAVRVKYNVLRDAGWGLAAMGHVQLPTGRERDLLGTGQAAVQPGVVGSVERERFAVDGNLGYSLRGSTRGFVYAGAVTVMGTPRVMVIGEVAGRRLAAADRLLDVATPHPTLAGVETIRLSAVEASRHELSAIGGVKWNVSGSWLVSASVLRTITTGGLTAGWIPSASIEHVFGR
jgi:hypothetical protein